MTGTVVGFNFDMKNLGFFTAYRIGKSSDRTKVRVIKDGHVVSYDLTDVLTIPLQFGNGIYNIYGCLRTDGIIYKHVAHRKLEVNMADVNIPYLIKNCYVNYNEEFTDAIKRRFVRSLTQSGLRDDVKIFVTQEFVYDYIGAIIRKNSMPDPIMCYQRRTGTCLDLASVTVAIYRSLGIYAKLVIGYVGKSYHAWTEVLQEDGTWQIFDPTREILHVKKRNDEYVPERWY